MNLYRCVHVHTTKMAVNWRPGGGHILSHHYPRKTSGAAPLSSKDQTLDLCKMRKTSVPGLAACLDLRSHTSSGWSGSRGRHRRFDVR
jgi:hypothetical protein